ncbi:uncharacterized protein LOC124931848 [Impatiens glandulifera]|uniref:uncharacterized protein LOC124931848 n=1 Tax=Impatiens glandulifera TaxID=253017 RepID=UPI001FB06B2E|nr:uncharacterized protein LOC124931848 [Impatiens glandulifera]
MRFLRKIAGFLGFPKDESHDDAKEVNHNNAADHTDFNNRVQTNLPRRGFSVPVQVPVDRPQIGPVLVPCNVGDGGVQGLKWYAKQLKIDEDGDVADEFIEEMVVRDQQQLQQQLPMPRFQVKHVARHAKVKNQAMSLDGKIRHNVEFQGRLQWV